MGCSDGSLPAQIWTIFQSDLIQLPLFVLPSLPAAGAEALLCRAAGRAWRVRRDKRDDFLSVVPRGRFAAPLVTLAADCWTLSDFQTSFPRSRHQTWMQHSCDAPTGPAGLTSPFPAVSLSLYRHPVVFSPPRLWHGRDPGLAACRAAPSAPRCTAGHGPAAWARAHSEPAGITVHELVLLII